MEHPPAPVQRPRDIRHVILSRQTCGFFHRRTASAMAALFCLFWRSLVLDCFRSTDVRGLYRFCSSHRSEEHTSELQSLMRILSAVFCLKKKKKPLMMLTTLINF